MTCSFERKDHVFLELNLYGFANSKKIGSNYDVTAILNLITFCAFGTPREK